MKMKMSIEDYLNCSFEITFCIDEDTMKTVVFKPEWEDDWMTVGHGDHFYDLNLWLDDDDSIRFAVYRLENFLELKRHYTLTSILIEGCD